MEKYDKIRNEKDISKLAQIVSEEFITVDIRLNGVKNNFDSVDERIKVLNAKINYLNILIEKNSNADFDTVK